MVMRRNYEFFVICEIMIIIMNTAGGATIYVKIDNEIWLRLGRAVISSWGLLGAIPPTEQQANKPPW